MSSSSLWRAPLLIVAAAAAAVVATLVVPDGCRLLLPLVDSVLEALLPDFDVRSVGLVTRGGGWSIAAQVVSHEYIVLGGRAWPPGLVVNVQTPAALLVRPVLLFGLGALWLHGRGEWDTRRGLMLAPAVLVLAALQVPLVMAGQVWALFLAAAEPTGRWTVTAVSEALLHGADIAIVTLAIFLSRSFGHGRMVLSDHPLPVFLEVRRGQPG